jgi:glycosyltransferase involved in cell wall biosynthesis
MSIHSFHVIGSRLSGGAEKFYCRLTAALAERGHPVTAVLPATSVLCDQLPAEVRQLHIGMRNVWDLWSALQLRRSIRAEAPPIVQTYMGRATRLVRLPAGRAPIHIARLGGYYNLKGYRHAHAWVGNTRGISDHLLRGGLPADRVFQIGNFVDPQASVSKDALTDLRHRLGLPNNARVVLSMGRLHPNKGFEDLLAAFAKLSSDPPLYLLIAGDGPLRSSLQRYARELKVEGRVIWPGWQKDVTRYYALGDVFVCPSRHEALGNVILEAWAHGVPVIATRSAGALELIREGENGLLVNVGDAGDLAARLQQLLMETAGGRQQLIDGGYKTLALKHSCEAVVTAYLDLYQQLLRLI